MVRLLLLPSAKTVPVELQAEFGALPSGMIPLGSQPALFHILAPYLAAGFQAAIAIGERGEVIRRHLDIHPDPRIRSIDVGQTASLAETVLEVLNRLERLPDHLVINFADTCLPGLVVPEGDAVFIARPQTLYRWTCFEADAGGGIGRIIDKQQVKEDGLAAFVGVFAIADVMRFRDALRAALMPAVQGAVEPFYVALKAYCDERPSPAVLQEVADWWDFGHLDTYYEVKQRYWTNLRFFNSLQISQNTGVVRKDSRNSEKLINEINWYLRLPKQIKYLCPRIFDFSIEPSLPFVEMEFYGYPPLNDMYLFGDYDPDVWVQVLSAVGDALDAMGRYRVTPEHQSSLVDASRAMYEHKTRDRLEQLRPNPRFGRFFHRELRINGRTVLGIDAVLERLPDAAADCGLYEATSFPIIHGDLCLSNILFDRRNRAVRLIDPRGSFGGFDLYGDGLYDLAKLSHSLCGDYDLIVNDLFTAGWTRDGFVYRTWLTERQKMVKTIFHHWMVKQHAADLLRIRLIESLLFLSMVPLHADRPAAQELFLATGLSLFSAVDSREVS